MKFDTDCKIEKVICKDVNRLNIQHAHLDVEKKRLVATDGKRMVVLGVTPEEHDVSGPVSADAIKAARKAKSGEIVCSNSSLAVANGPMFTRETGVQFPDVDRAVPTFNEGSTGTVTIALNAKYLAEIAEALGTTNVTLTFQMDTAKYGPILVLNPKLPRENRFAALMPVRK